MNNLTLFFRSLQIWRRRLPGRQRGNFSPAPGHTFDVSYLRTLLLAAVPLAAAGQSNELAFTLGLISSPDRQVAGPAQGRIPTTAGTAFQVNYGRRLAGGGVAALLFEVQFLASPLREVESANPLLTRDYATLYLTPGLRLKFNPRGTVAPFVSAGGGYALYEQSERTIGGADNPAPRLIHRGAFTAAGGVDVRLWRFLSLRGEVRAYRTGNPVFNLRLTESGQRNLVAGGGFVLSF